jgi:hypothetical protein
MPAVGDTATPRPRLPRRAGGRRAPLALGSRALTSVAGGDQLPSHPAGVRHGCGRLWLVTGRRHWSTLDGKNLLSTNDPTPQSRGPGSDRLRQSPSALSVVESMACGTAVIAFRLGVHARGGRGGRHGFVVDIAELAANAVTQPAEIDRGGSRTRARRRFARTAWWPTACGSAAHWFQRHDDLLRLRSRRVPKDPTQFVGRPDPAQVRRPLRARTARHTRWPVGADLA